MKKSFFWFAIFLFSASVAQAYTAFWRGSAGDNRWSNPKNWREEHIPGPGDGAYIYSDVVKSYSPAGTANPGLIIVDASVSNIAFAITRSDAKITAAECVPMTIRFESGCYVDCGGTPGSDVGNNFECDSKGVFDIRLENIDVRNAKRVNLTGKVDFTGSSSLTAYCLHINAGADFTLESGRIKLSRFNYATLDSAIGSARIKGGELEFASLDGNVSHANARFEQTGGIVRYLSTSGSLSGLPMFLPKGGRFLMNAQGSSALMPFSSSSEKLSFNGELYMTNVTASSSSARLLINQPDVWLASASTQSVGAVYVPSPGQDPNLRLAGLNLHGGFTAAKSTWIYSFFGGVSFGAYGSDWSAANCYQKVFGPLEIRTTDCFDGTTPRTILFENISVGRAPSLKVTGSGRANLLMKATGLGALETSHPWQYSDVTVGAGATLHLYSNGTSPLGEHTTKLTLEDNSTLILTYPLAMLRAFEKPTIGTGVKVQVRLPKNQNGGYFDLPKRGIVNPVIDFGRDADLSNVTAEIVLNETTTDWELRKIGSCLVLVDSTYAYAPTANAWTGAGADSKLSTKENWSTGVVPKTNTKFYFDGITKTVVTNDLTTQSGILGDGAGIGQLDVGTADSSAYASDHACTFVFDGNPIYLENGGYTSSAASIFHAGHGPLIINCDLAKRNNSGTFSAVCNGQGWIGLMGSVSLSGLNFVVAGDVVVGGTVTCGNLEFAISYSRGRRNASYLTILDGGSVIVENQTSDQTLPGKSSPAASARFVVAKGGLLDVRDGVYCNAQAMTTNSIVDGTARFAKLGGATDFEICGTGLIELGGVVPSDSRACKVELGGGLTLRPASWTTVTADAPDTPMTLDVLDDLTLGATNDWTYGAAAGVMSSAAVSEHAIRVRDYAARLTFDTEDPTTHEGHTITLDAPILGSGVRLVKKGAGSLVMNAADNTFETFDIQGGDVGVNGDVDLAKVTVSRTFEEEGWKRVLSVPSGKMLTNWPTLANSSLRRKIVTEKTGAVSLYCRRPSGFRIIFY